MIGTRVKISHSVRWGEIVAGPRKMFGDTKYQVRIEMQGRETVQQTVWLSAAVLLVPKTTSQEKA